jgi:hypothetical protein
MNERNIARFLRRDGLTGVFRAALFGIPLPLCSCSVLPVATQLHRSGVGRGGVVSFLVSTPESGVDSIALTYSLTDPLLTVARPVAAFAAALAAGTIEVLRPLTGRRTGTQAPSRETAVVTETPPAAGGLVGGVRYAFTDLLADLAPYLVVGYLLAGVTAAALGGEAAFLPATVRSGWIGYAGALVLGLPMYICATSSTPLAAVLLAAGFSPGAVLVFLLVGPATNLASVVVVRSVLGLMATIRYLVVIAVVAVISGLVIDQLYGLLELTPEYTAGNPAAADGWLHTAAAALLSLLIVFHGARKLRRRPASLRL